MARLASYGWEFQTTTNGVEAEVFTGTTAISTTTVRTGSASLRFNPTTSTGNVQMVFDSSAHSGRVFGRVYIRFAALPTSVTNALHANEIDIVALGISNNYSAYVTLGTDGKLRLYDFNDAIVGSASAVLNTNQWYRLEIGHEITSAFLELKLDGSVIATENANPGIAIDRMVVGPNAEGVLAGSSHTCSIDMFCDDIGINDNSGGNQNTYPGAGQLVYLWPNAAGDNNAWSVQVGGTAGSSNNFTRVDETTPDDSTSYNGDIVLNNTDDYKMQATPASIGSSDTINVVTVRARYRAAVAAAEASFVLRFKKASSGTPGESSAITPSSTTWVTTTNGAPKFYQNPDSTTITKATLDTSQIGMRISTQNTNAADISTIVLIVDSTPVASSGGNTGIGKWLKGGFKGPESFF